MKTKYKRAVSILMSALMTTSAAGIPASAAEPVNLVPSESTSNAPNYVCTWNEQVFLSHDTHPMTRDVIDDDHLFGKDGWCNTMAPESVRKDLIFLLDDGWDMPYSYSPAGTNSSYLFEVSPDKFPNYGTAPKDRLKKLAENVEACGWKGLGLWVRVETLSESFWREKVEWSKYAGVKYWKCDWGNEQNNDNFRKMLCRLADEIYPELVMEHASPIEAFSATDGFSSSTFNSWADRLSYSDVFRTYDVVAQLSIPDTMARASGLYKAAYSDGRAKNLINVEDELYTAVGLGSTFGVMRHPTGYDDIRDDVVFGDARYQNTRPILYMKDEIARAAKWNRIAPAYNAAAYAVSVSAEVFTDSWNFRGDDTWFSAARNKTMTQKAPASVTRGLPLPTVACDSGDKPYVLANRNPNGAICVATVGRTSADDIGYHTNDTAHISIDAGDLTGKIGVFGIYGSLTLKFNQPLAGKTVLAQDLLADSAQDITDKVTIDGDTITIPGDLITQIGTSAKTENDPSEPGLVIQIGSEADFADAPPVKVRDITLRVGESMPVTDTAPSGAVWTSADQSVATVDKDGVVTAVSAGRTTVMLSSDGTKQIYGIRVTEGLPINLPAVTKDVSNDTKVIKRVGISDSKWVWAHEVERFHFNESGKTTSNTMTGDLFYLGTVDLDGLEEIRVNYANGSEMPGDDQQIISFYTRAVDVDVDSQKSAPSGIPYDDIYYGGSFEYGDPFASISLKHRISVGWNSFGDASTNGTAGSQVGSNHRGLISYNKNGTYLKPESGVQNVYVELTKTGFDIKHIDFVYKKDIPLSKDASLKTISIKGTPLANFKPDTLNYSYTLKADEKVTANDITAVANDSAAAVNTAITDKNAVITVTAGDGETSRQYTIDFTRDTVKQPLSGAKVKATSASYNSVKLSWNSVPEAKSYQILRAGSKNGSYKKIAEVSGLTFTNKKLITGKKYYYKIRAISADGRSADSGTVKAAAVLGMPEVKLKAANTKIKASWKKVAGATKYVVYFAKNKAKKFKTAATVAKNKFTFKKLIKGKKYFIKVRAYRKISGKKVYGKYSKIKMQKA